MAFKADIADYNGCSEGSIILHKGKKEIGTLRIKVTTSDIKDFATLALNKLVDDEVAKNVKQASGKGKIETYVEQGKKLIRSDYTSTLVTNMAPFAEVIDAIAQVRRNMD